MHADNQIVAQTLNWVRTFIVAHDICPFAQRELARDTIRVEVVRSKKIEVALGELMVEVQWLDEHPETETTLLVFPTLFKSFDHYLDFVELAESILVDQGYEGTYQSPLFIRITASTVPSPMKPLTIPTALPTPWCICCAKRVSKRRLSFTAIPTLFPSAISLS